MCAKSRQRRRLPGTPGNVVRRPVPDNTGDPRARTEGNMKVIPIILVAALALTACAPESGDTGGEVSESSLRGREAGHWGSKGRSGFAGNNFAPPAGR